MKQLINFVNNRCKDVAFPERTICFSEKEFYTNINKYNGKKSRIYYSIFDCDETRNFNDANIHVIPFDLDNKNGLDSLIKLWNFCKERNLKSLYVFSTKGFWCYIFTKNQAGLKNKKNALLTATKKIAQELNFTVGFGKQFDVDESVVGDIARIGRLPNGYDVNRQRFCIPITIEDMQKGYDWICEKSKNQCFKFVYYNNDFFDISKFDSEPEKIKNMDITVSPENLIETEDIDLFIPCVKSWLEEPDTAINRARYFFAVYCKETGISAKSCDLIAKKYWEGILDSTKTMSKYDEFVQEHQIRYAYNLTKKFPTCGALMAKSLCPGKCHLFKGEDKSPLYR